MLKLLGKVGRLHGADTALCEVGCGGNKKSLVKKYGTCILRVMNKTTKSDVIDKGYNRKKRGTISNKKAMAAKRAAEDLELLRVKKQMEGWDKEILDLTDKIEKDKERLRALKKKAGYSLEEDSAKGGNGKDVTMLRDMWQIYRQAGGVARLKQVMKDDKEFRAMVKEMLKVEAMVSTRKRMEESQAGQVVFVILKGLQTEQDVIAEHGGITPEVKRAIAMVDPSGGEYHE